MIPLNQHSRVCFSARKSNIIDSNPDQLMTNLYFMMGCSDHEGGNVSAHTGHLVSYFSSYPS